MSFFEFPHTRTYDSDLGWLIKHTKELTEKYNELTDGSSQVTVYTNETSGSHAWESGITYPALQLVKYEGVWYMSTKEIPASIGNPPANPYYWAVFTDTSADPSTLTVNELAPRQPKNRKIYFVTDSFGGVTTPNFISIAADTCGFEATQIYRASYGFVSDGVKTFYNLLLEAEVVNGDTYTDLVVVGGNNDLGKGATATETAVGTFFTLARTLFPNAKFWLGMTGRRLTGAENNNLLVLASAYKDACENIGASFFDLTEYQHQYALFSDSIHPNAAGAARLALGLGGALANGTTPAEVYATMAPTITPVSGISMSGTSWLYMRMCNHMCSMRINPATITINTSGIIPRDEWTTIGTITDSLMNPETISVPFLRGSCVVFAATKTTVGEYQILINGLNIRFKWNALQNTVWIPSNEVTSIQLFEADKSIPALLC